MTTVEERLDALESTVKSLVELIKLKEYHVTISRDESLYDKFKKLYVANGYKVDNKKSAQIFKVTTKTIYNWRKRIEKNL